MKNDRQKLVYCLVNCGSTLLCQMQAFQFCISLVSKNEEYRDYHLSVGCWSVTQIIPAIILSVVNVKITAQSHNIGLSYTIQDPIISIISIISITRTDRLLGQMNMLLL